jgi:hypothetical protein
MRGFPSPALRGNPRILFVPEGSAPSYPEAQHYRLSRCWPLGAGRLSTRGLFPAAGRRGGREVRSMAVPAKGSTGFTRWSP